ncbi:NapC/NirT family cytochrome c [Marinobacterium aestuariivivens]|uniref:Cytochrome c-type protein n=1 Tax=Marinobacterium aestuariivivens TaxID=1698799 RepID=A0ABW2A823_9GAMM
MGIKKLWHALWRPSIRYPVVMLIGAGILIGAVFSGAFASFVQHSNSEAYCTSCHEMETVQREYQESFHYRNPAGVRAICSDCHVPPGNWAATVLFKIGKMQELFAHYRGTLDTEEKFEARRLELAERVWRRMEASESAPCRNCHSMTAMDLEKQRPRARGQHESAREAGETCIDCHKGIAHRPVQALPEPQTPESGDFAL